MKLFAALLSHYRRHPLQLLALAAMMVVASALWTGVSHLTSQARASLGQSERAVAERAQVERVDGMPVTVADFVALRRAGHCVMPWLEVERPASTGRVVGIDPLAAACFGQPAESYRGWDQPLNGEPFLDIREAKNLAAAEDGARATLSLLLSGPPGQPALPEAYRRAPFSLGPDTGELGESFLLNLDALGVLVLLITALLLRSVHQLGLAQRRDSFALLHRFGVPEPAVRRALVIEIVLLAAVCVVPGVALGRLLAGGLGSGFGQALESLFDVPLFAGQGSSWLTPVLTMMAVVLAVCLADQLHFSGRQVIRRLAGQGYRVTLLTLVAGLALAFVSSSLALTFVAIALVFAGAGVLAPGLISELARRCGRASAAPLTRWQCAEIGVLARRLALPLVALQFALAMVLAVQALVTVFEATFDDWLSQRLAADYFIEVPAGADSLAAADWLETQSPLAGSGRWHRVVRGRAILPAVDGWPGQTVDLFALGPVSNMLGTWRLQAAIDAPWEAFSRGQGIMVNEQLARRRQLSVGDSLTLALAGERWTAPVLAVYPDYGRPAGEVLIHAAQLPAGFRPDGESFAISPDTADLDAVTSGLKRVWQTETLSLRDNGRIRALADSVFEQTFLLTRSMTVLTLILAAMALLIMGWVFFTTRVWYYRLLAVWGMGPREVAGQLVRLSVTLTMSIAVLALPLGIWLTWALVHRVNPQAFGWSLPMAVYPEFWFELAGLSLIIGLSIAALMRRQLRQPAAMPVSASGLSGGER
ncbi:FtsX-like permease family protein [Marinobacter sp. M216]|uniref:FtsX-like permease family protein n=1 Tax=Marinobacter albus TaxID=3030833 RepID=A0ABT7HGN2_9GAMM|nr:FtsX-like permease family protein [Marinobacter sp. M216]MDK9558640.1 FtsX-like permease family protein [Marinobacter sp. M216]